MLFYRIYQQILHCKKIIFSAVSVLCMLKNQPDPFMTIIFTKSRYHINFILLCIFTPPPTILAFELCHYKQNHFDCLSQHNKQDSYSDSWEFPTSFAGREPRLDRSLVLGTAHSRLSGILVGLHNDVQLLLLFMNLKEHRYAGMVGTSILASMRPFMHQLQ